jgi:hypothetical protein
MKHYEYLLKLSSNSHGKKLSDLLLLFMVANTSLIFVTNSLISVNVLLTTWQEKTYSMKQSPPLNTNQFSASQEIPHISWNLKVHYSILKCVPLNPILSQPDTPYPPPHNITSWRSVLIYYHLCLGLKKCLLSLRFPHQNHVYASPLTHKYLHAPPI